MQHKKIKIAANNSNDMKSENEKLDSMQKAHKHTHT